MNQESVFSKSWLLFFQLILVLTLFISPSNLSANKDSSTAYYLVPRLNLEMLSVSDRSLIDSMLTIFYGCEFDSCKLDAISVIVEESWDDKVWPKYNEWIHDFAFERLAESSNPKSVRYFKKALAGSLNNMGYLANSHGDVEIAVAHFEQCVKIYKGINDRVGLASTFINLGHIYDNRGVIAKALDYYYKSLNIQEELNNAKGIGTALNGIGFIYYKQGESTKALENYEKSLAIRERINDQYGIATCLNNIGLLYKDEGELEKALTYYESCLVIDEKLNNKDGIATSLTNIGIILEKQNNFKEALLNYQRSLELRKAGEDKSGIAHSLNNIAFIYKLQGKLPEAETTALEAMSLARELNYPKTIRNISETLTSIYRAKGDWKNAFASYALFIEMRDSLNNEETTKQSIHKGYQYEYEKQVITDSIKAIEYQKVQKAKLVAIELEKEAANTLANQRKQQAIFLLVGLALLLVFAFILFRRLKTISKQKEFISKQKKEVEQKNELIKTSRDQIEEQNKHVMDSIHYAKLIQNALLKSEEHLGLNFKDKFIFFQPKDIISGDFYWMTEKHGYIYAAVGDCTGHGVPGAMLTMLGTSILNEILAREQLLDPATILNELKDRIINELSQQNDEQVKDGMDIALIKYSSTTKEVLFSGANRPLWLIRDEKIITIKGDRQCIGHNFNSISFTNHTIPIQENDLIYLSSDGYVDQFGGELDKKIRLDRFLNLILSMHKIPMEAQAEKIEDYFIQWKGDNEQTDDICVMGLRF